MEVAVTVIVGGEGRRCDVGVVFLFLLFRQRKLIAQPLPLLAFSDSRLHLGHGCEHLPALSLALFMAVVVAKPPVFKTWTQGGGS